MFHKPKMWSTWKMFVVKSPKSYQNGFLKKITFKMFNSHVTWDVTSRIYQVVTWDGQHVVSLCSYCRTARTPFPKLCPPSLHSVALPLSIIWLSFLHPCSFFINHFTFRSSLYKNQWQQTGSDGWWQQQTAERRMTTRARKKMVA